MLKLIALTSILCLSACTSSKNYDKDLSKYLKSGEQLIVCESQYNIPSKLVYYKSKQIENKIDVPQMAEPFSSYYITDVLGNVYTINSNEIENYSCSEVKTINNN